MLRTYYTMIKLWEVCMQMNISENNPRAKVDRMVKIKSGNIKSYWETFKKNSTPYLHLLNISEMPIYFYLQVLQEVKLAPFVASERMCGFWRYICGGLPVVAETETKRRFKIWYTFSCIYLFFMNILLFCFLWFEYLIIAYIVQYIQRK
jgi:hypothetical protein